MEKLMRLMATLLLLALALVLGWPGEVEAQQTCASDLVPCGQYLNLTTGTPPDSCCTPLRNAVSNELPCLCSILTDRRVSSAFNITIESATRIARACGITNLNGCTSGPPPSSTPPPPPSSGCPGLFPHRRGIPTLGSNGGLERVLARKGGSEVDDDDTLSGGELVIEEEVKGDRMQPLWQQNTSQRQTHDKVQRKIMW